MMRVPYAIALLLLVVAPTMAEDPSEFLSPRTEKSEPPDVVDLGVLQIETAAYVQHASGAYQCAETNVARATRNELSNGAWLVRLGVGDGAELRIEGAASSESLSVDSCATSSRLDARVSALSAPAIGMKLRLFDEEHDLASLSIAGSVTLQDEGAGLIADLSPTMRLTAGRSLGDDFAIIANIAASWDGTTIAPAGAYTLSLTAALDESIGVYTGIAGDLALNAETSHSLDAGIGYTINNTLSAELFGALGLTPTAPDFYGGLGLVIGIN